MRRASLSPRLPRAATAAARRSPEALLRHEGGAVAVEMGLVGGIFFLVLLTLMELGHAFWQYNAAAKALHLGARIAVVSDPVAADLKGWSGLSGMIEAGDAMPSYARACSGRTSTCSGGTFDRAALEGILYGPGNRSCPAASQSLPPPCRVFPRLRPENLEVDYVHTGLGYAGRPGGPVPTITVRIANLTFDFVVLNRLLGLSPLRMDGMSATATGEDLSAPAS